MSCTCYWLERAFAMLSTNVILTMSRWESRKNNTEGVADEYLCHACYIPKEDWKNSLPQGYEDVKNMTELRARKKKLDGSSQGSQSVIPAISK
jgi:hypothetical protein